MYMTWIALFAVKMAFSLSGFLNAKQRKSQNVCVCICEEAVRCGIWLQPTHLAIIALKGDSVLLAMRNFPLAPEVKLSTQTLSGVYLYLKPNGNYNP